MFERDQKILVQLLLFAAGLMFQRGALRDGIVLLGVAGRNFLAVDAALENGGCCPTNSSMHRQVGHQWNVHNAIAAVRLKDDERFSSRMHRHIILALNLNFRTIRQPHAERAKRTLLNRSFDGFSRHGANITIALG